MPTEVVTYWTTSTVTKWITTATANVTSTILSYTLTTLTTDTRLNVIGSGWNILIVPILVFAVITILAVILNRKRH